MSRNVTPLSPDCSLIILSNEKRRGMREREREKKMHANCNSFIQPAYGVCNHKPEKNPYGTIKLIVSSPFFFPLTGCVSTTLHITSLKERVLLEYTVAEQGCKERAQSIPIFAKASS